MNEETVRCFTNILYEELIPALGCTEPIAIALASSTARVALGDFPDSITIRCSRNIIKNVKGVIVPKTKNMKGIRVSCILGAISGNPDKFLQVLEDVTEEDVERTRVLLEQGLCTSELLENVDGIEIHVLMTKGENSSKVIITKCHTNIAYVEANGEILVNTLNEDIDNCKENPNDKLNLKDIYEYALNVDINEVKSILDEQINVNTAIALEGLKNEYGTCVGKTLLEFYNNEVDIVARAYAAAGSDARMGGCTLPVVINSGSGNQGITVSLPVVIYSNFLKVGDEKMYRALLISNLVAILQKKWIGKLSAYCGAVSAACGSGAAITYLYGGDYNAIARTITNTLGNVSGIVCDGAKPSCAAKISSAIEAAILGHKMSMSNRVFAKGDGLVKGEIEETMKCICRMGREGMKGTDIEILNIMLEN